LTGDNYVEYVDTETRYVSFTSTSSSAIVADSENGDPILQFVNIITPPTPEIPEPAPELPVDSTPTDDTSPVESEEPSELPVDTTPEIPESAPQFTDSINASLFTAKAYHKYTLPGVTGGK
jgi:hypothetical protein